MNIFKKWKEKDLHKNCIFITDGIVNETYWQNSNYKILFLLKEAYGKEKHLPDLINNIKAKGRTFKPLGQWAYGIQQVMLKNDIADFPQKQNIINNALLKSAVINVKKSNGNKKSNANNLKKYIEEDWNLIYKQIQNINPHIIICGKVFALIKHKLNNIKQISDRIYTDDKFIYVDFWHPANRSSNHMNYYALSAMLLKFIQKNNR